VLHPSYLSPLLDQRALLDSRTRRGQTAGAHDAW
jgi:hypothetical protein